MNQEGSAENTAEFVEEVDNLFDSFSGAMHVEPGKTLHFLLSDDSPHIGYWTKASMEEDSDRKQSLVYPSEKLVGSVGTSNCSGD